MIAVFRNRRKTTAPRRFAMTAVGLLLLAGCGDQEPGSAYSEEDLAQTNAQIAEVAKLLTKDLENLDEARATGMIAWIMMLEERIGRLRREAFALGFKKQEIQASLESSRAQNASRPSSDVRDIRIVLGSILFVLIAGGIVSARRKRRRRTFARTPGRSL